MPTGDAMDARRPVRYRQPVVARPPGVDLAEDDEYAWLARPQRVLLAEDDERMRRLVANALRDDGFDVIEARHGAEFLEWVGFLLLHPRAGRPVDLIITDLRMPFETGVEILVGLGRAASITPVILMTAFGDETTHAEARRLGANAVFDKPFDVNDLRSAALHFAGE